jgi:hypothetical protein
VTVAQELVHDASFRPAQSIDAGVPLVPGVYSIRLRDGSALPEPFESLLGERSTRLVYIGKATSLGGRMLGNELRGRGHGTFFRSIGAVLGFRPRAGSLAEKVNRYNFSFEPSDRVAIVRWINDNLDVSWREVPLADLPALESELIRLHAPLLNLDGNPLALVELDELRVLCRQIALGS